MNEPASPEATPAFHDELMRLLLRTEARRRPGVPTKIPSLAKAIGKSQASVYAYFDGTTVPSPRVLDDILSVLEVSLAERGRLGRLRDDAQLARRRGGSRYASASPTEVTHNLPPRSAVFVGRDLRGLTGLVDVNRYVAIHGLSGVGKTELALQYAYGRRNDLQLIWWTVAESASQVTAGLAGLARHVRPDWETRDSTAAEWAMSWLRSHDRWLLVLDNVDRFEDIAGLLAELRDCGSIVITTRLNPGTARWRELGLTPLPLDVLNREGSVTLLLELTGMDDPTGAARLAHETGDLPLALSQAAAYIAQQPNVGFDAYKHMFAERFHQIAAARPARDLGRRTIAATLSVAMDRAVKDSPLAAEVLSVLSYMAGVTLPEVVVGSLADIFEVKQALASLAAYHIVDRDETGVRVHRLVQAVARLRDNQANEHRARAVAALEATMPEDPDVNVAGWPQWAALIPHVEALMQRLSSGEQSPGSLNLRNQAAVYLQTQGHVSRALVEFESVVADSERLLGFVHPNTRDKVADLASAYVAAARISRAIPLMESLVPLYRQDLGATSPRTLQQRAELANAYRLRGHPDTAAKLLEQIVADYDGNGPDLWTTRTLLAAAYTDGRRYDDAATTLIEVHAEQRRVLGDNHPATLVSRHNLARVRREAGQIGEAMAEFVEILALQEAALGAKNPHTFATRGNLALTEQAAGRLAEAIELLDSLLADTAEAIGQDHWVTLTTLRYLANAHLANGEVTEAIALLEQAESDHHRLLGNIEPLTFLARNDLATAYDHAGRVGDAAATYAALLADQESILGPDHVDTVATRSCLARLREHEWAEQPDRGRGPAAEHIGMDHGRGNP